jgi:hypothetical protein
LTNVVIVNRKGVQMRQSNGRYAPKIVPPAVAASAGPSSQRTPGPNRIVPVEQSDRKVGPGVYQAQPETPSSTGYRVIK